MLFADDISRQRGNLSERTRHFALLRHLVCLRRLVRSKVSITFFFIATVSITFFFIATRLIVFIVIYTQRHWKPVIYIMFHFSGDPRSVSQNASCHKEQQYIWFMGGVLNGYWDINYMNCRGWGVPPGDPWSVPHEIWISKIDAFLMALSI